MTCFSDACNKTASVLPGIILIILVSCQPCRAWDPWISELGATGDILFSGIFVLLVLAVAWGGVLTRRYRQLALDVKRKTAAVDETNRQYRLLLENSGDGIVVVVDDVVRFANQKIYDIIGIPYQDKAPVHLMDHIHPDDRKEVITKYQKHFEQQSRTFDYQFRIQRGDDSTAWVHIRSIPVNWQGQEAGLTFVRDITSHKIVESQLQQAQRMEAIGTLAGGIAHDFNNILTTITGNAQLAMMDMDENSPGAHEFEQILKAGYRARELVRQILAVSRKNSEAASPISPGPIVKEAVKLLRSTFPSSIRIIDNILPQNARLKADPTQIHQVVLNLCTNARQAMENMDTGTLTVSLSVVDNTGNLSKSMPSLEQSRYFELRISDTGEGIDPADSRKIFDPYYTTRPQGVGSGLGLATTMGIVRQYGGQIIVDSRPGSGATFMVYLPVFQEQSGSSDLQADIPAKKPARGHGRILFVDDEEEILAIGEKMFNNLGYSVTTAHSGKEAFDLFSRKPERFDILVTDMAMPGMTGLMLAKQVFKIRPGFPVVMCTGYSETIDHDTAMELGIKAYVAKPYKLTDLADVVSSHLQNKENRSIAPAVP